MSATDEGQRVKAARAWGGFDSQAKLADAIGSSAPVVWRIENGQRAMKRTELWAIADVCGVPRWFLEGGWDNYPSSIDDLARDALEDIAGRDDDEQETG
jgi:transcriptional regulator with XRE-family HTH domain